MRINVLPMSLLTDQHLLAEFVEMKMLIPALKRSIKAADGKPIEIPKEYCLNKGHAKFFYNKLAYVQRRRRILRLALTARGYDIVDPVDLPFYGELPNIFKGQYHPTSEAKKINAERILQRISLKPGWYTLKGKTYTFEEYKKIYETRLRMKLKENDG